MSDVPHRNESAGGVIIRRYIVLPREKGREHVLNATGLLPSPMYGSGYNPDQMRAFERAVEALDVRNPVMVFVRHGDRGLAMQLHPCRKVEELRIETDRFGIPRTVVKVQTASTLDSTVFTAQMVVDLKWPRVWVHGKDLKTFYTTGGYPHEAPASTTHPDYSERAPLVTQMPHPQYGWMVMPLNVYAAMLPVDAAKQLGKIKALGWRGEMAAEYAAKLDGNYWKVGANQAKAVEERDVPQRAVQEHNRKECRRKRFTKYIPLVDTLVFESKGTLSRATVMTLLYNHLEKDETK